MISFFNSVKKKLVKKKDFSPGNGKDFNANDVHSFNCGEHVLTIKFEDFSPIDKKLVALMDQKEEDRSLTNYNTQTSHQGIVASQGKTLEASNKDQNQEYIKHKLAGLINFSLDEKSEIKFKDRIATKIFIEILEINNDNFENPSQIFSIETQNNLLKLYNAIKDKRSEKFHLSFKLNKDLSFQVGKEPFTPGDEEIFSLSISIEFKQLQQTAANNYTTPSN